MGGIADEREPLGDERARDRKGRAEGAARTDRLDLAEMEPEAPLQLGVEVSVGQRDDARRLLAPARSRRSRSGGQTASRFSGRIANGPAGRKCSSARP